MEEYLQEIIANFLTAADIQYSHISIDTENEDDKPVYNINIDCNQAGQVIGLSLIHI